MPADIAVVLFASNVLGVACARSLHFQFLLWYWHALPLLLDALASGIRAAAAAAGSSAGVRTLPVVGSGGSPAAAGAGGSFTAGVSALVAAAGIPWLLRIVATLALELAWGVHPPVPLGSLVVTLAHAALAGLLVRYAGWMAAALAPRGKAGSGRRGGGTAGVGGAGSSVASCGSASVP